MKRLKIILIWSMIAAYLALALGFIIEKRDSLVCTDIDVRVVDSVKNEFIKEKHIVKYIENKGYKMVGKKFQDINLAEVESVINDYPLVEKAEVYKTIKGTVAVDVKQRTPILRVIDSRSVNYYIDENGKLMNTSNNYSSYVLVATGHINTPFLPYNRTDVINMVNKSKNHRIIADLYQLAKYIVKDKFWNAQIQQIYVRESGEFELIPTVGQHTIFFGDITDYETKFQNLLSLYKNGLPVLGWNTYHTINVKFKGQIVCTKRL